MENNKKLGIILMVISLVIGLIFVYYILNLSEKSVELGCFNDEDCIAIERGLSVSHIAVGILSFILSLGFYLIVFNKENIVKQKKYDISKLNKEERGIFSFIRENKDDGVYQSSIIEKFGLQKSKVSRILDKLERLNLIERKRRGMTNIILLK